MRLLQNIYIFTVQKFAGLIWGIRYNPKKYWAARGLTYRKELEQKFEKNPDSDRNLTLILETLKKYDFSSFLEVGCGYGLYLKFIEAKFNLEKIHGCDISPTQIKEARKFLDPASKVILKETNGVSLPYPDKGFDVTFTYGVCIHVPPVKIVPFIREILRVTRRHYIFIESSTGKDAFYYFSHDYYNIFLSIGVKLVVLKEFGNTERLYVANCPN